MVAACTLLLGCFAGSGSPLGGALAELDVALVPPAPLLVFLLLLHAAIARTTARLADRSATDLFQRTDDPLEHAGQAMRALSCGVTMTRCHHTRNAHAGGDAQLLPTPITATTVDNYGVAEGRTRKGRTRQIAPDKYVVSRPKRMNSYIPT
jgi:hypothetical protein